MKSVKFYTLGCKVNQYETQEIRERFLEAGFREAEGKQRADIYVVNTCTVTAKADKDSFYYIHRGHRENPRAKIIVTGCLAGLDRKKILAQPGVIRVVANPDKAKIAAALAGGRGSAKRGISSFAGHTRAFVKIQDGCDNRCSYCRVPLARGRSRSRDHQEVVRDAEKLVANGFQEIVLTGICLGSYGKDLSPKRSLAELIGDLEKIEGLLRIRLSSIEAADVTTELIELLAGSGKLCPHLHIPVQSGDDLILKKMNRKYSRSDYLDLVRRIRKRIPGIAITTDVLVGFPGETEDNFRNTLELIKEIRPLKVHIFPFSSRPGTAAAKFAGSCAREAIKQRSAALAKAAERCAGQYLKKFLLRNKDVLIEGLSPESGRLWEGYTDNYIKVLVRSPGKLKNRMINVRLEAIRADNLLGVKNQVCT